MYSKIMIPVDLAHADKLEKAMETAANIAKAEKAELLAAGVTTSQPSAVAHNPAEFHQKLEDFAVAVSRTYGVEFMPLALTSHDPVRDLDDVLMRAIEEEGVDLVVMASHVPGLVDHIFASNAGYLASHSSASVFVVR